MWINEITKKVCKTHSDIRIDSGVSYPENITDEMISDNGYLPVTIINPTFDPIREYINELPPALVEGVYVQQWEILPFDDATIWANMQNESLARGYGLIVPTTPPEYTPGVQKLVELSPVINSENQWEQRWAVVEMTMDEIIEYKNQIINSLSNTLDEMILNKGLEKRYSGPDSYAKYIVSNPVSSSPTYEIELRYKEESIAMTNWIMSVFATSENIMIEVEQGLRPIPTQEELLAELPNPPW